MHPKKTYIYIYIHIYSKFPCQHLTIPPQKETLPKKPALIIPPTQPTKTATKSTKTQAGNEATCPGLSNLIAIFAEELLIGLSSLPIGSMGMDGMGWGNVVEPRLNSGHLYHLYKPGFNNISPSHTIHGNGIFTYCEWSICMVFM